MGRIYDLEDSLDRLIKDKKFQIEMIGEDSYWTYRVSLRKWNNDLQRYTYEDIGRGTCSEFLDAYDSIAQMIASHNK
jgi:hypothetical protein